MGVFPYVNRNYFGLNVMKKVAKEGVTMIVVIPENSFARGYCRLGYIY